MRIFDRMLTQLFADFSKTLTNLTSTLVYVFAILLILILTAIWYYHKVGRKAYYLRKCPAMPRYPFVGNVTFLTNGLFKPLPPDATTMILQGTLGLTKIFQEKLYVFWLGWNPLVVLYKPEFVETVLSSNTLIEKSFNYDLLHPWLGRGLLTNTGDKWRSRRKLLTPAFHFRIIDDFMPIINEHSFTFVDRLKLTVGSTIDDICPYVTSCTLDIICDTAMGVKINAQRDTNSEYVKAVYILGESFMRRNLHISGWFDFIFYRTEFGKQYTKSLNTLHEFTRRVIRDRKQEILHKRIDTSSLDEDLAVGRKKRMAFLDLLLEHHLSPESKLSEEDIREEVDTFMFEGHDTTAMAISWSLHLIGLDPEVQEKVHLEIDSVFGDDKTRPVNSEDLKQLKYLECCIKEALRLFPSVPGIARAVNEDFRMGSYTIPKGATLFIYPFALHRNEEIFSDPEVYRPERFLTDSISKTSPYAYVPFSAGPRNCIGQRFALTEEKIVIANVFRNFSVKSLDHRDKIKAAIELVTRPKDPLRISLKLR